MTTSVSPPKVPPGSGEGMGVPKSGSGAFQPIPPVSVSGTKVNSAAEKRVGIPGISPEAQPFAAPVAAAAIGEGVAHVRASLLGKVIGAFKWWGSHKISQGQVGTSIAETVAETVAWPAIDCSLTGPLEGVEGGKAFSNPKRKEISYAFERKGVKYGTDVATPIPTKTTTIESLKVQKKKLEEALKAEPKGNSIERGRLERRIELCDKAIKTSEQNGEYLPSGGVVKRVNDGEKPGDIQSAELVNCYREKFVDRNGVPKGSFLRFGALTHRTKGLCNLRMLKKIGQDELLQRESKDNSISSADYSKSQELAEEERAQAFREFEQLQKKQSKGHFGREHSLTKAQENAFEEAKSSLDNQAIVGPKGTTAAQLALEEHRFLLEQQMLQVLSLQIEEHGKNDEDLHLFQLSLLNPSTRKVDKNGIPHCEDNLILDEAEILKEFNERTIHLDAEGPPYIDAKGEVHVKRPAQMKTATVVKVKTHFANVVVQKPVSRSKAQKLYEEVNEDVFKEMDELLGKQIKARSETGEDYVEAARMRTKLEKCRAAVQAHKSNYQIAEDLAEVGRFLGWNLSLNCYSGKDRTGFVSFRVIQQMLAKVIDKKVISDREKSETKQFFAYQVFDEKAIPRMITKANGWIHVKVLAITFPGLNSLPGRIRGIWAMVSSFIEVKV